MHSVNSWIVEICWCKCGQHFIKVWINMQWSSNYCSSSSTISLYNVIRSNSLLGSAPVKVSIWKLLKEHNSILNLYRVLIYSIKYILTKNVQYRQQHGVNYEWFTKAPVLNLIFNYFLSTIYLEFYKLVQVRVQLV